MFKKQSGQHGATLSRDTTRHTAVSGKNFFNLDQHDGVTTLVTDKQDFVLVVKDGTVRYDVNLTKYLNDIPDCENCEAFRLMQERPCENCKCSGSPAPKTPEKQDDKTNKDKGE